MIICHGNEIVLLVIGDKFFVINLSVIVTIFSMLCPAMVFSDATLEQKWTQFNVVVTAIM